MYNTTNNNNKYMNSYGNGSINGSGNANKSLPLPSPSSSSLTFANRSAAMITPNKVKQKLTLSAVIGKIIVYSAEDGSTRIGQWGGTECFLSIQPNWGPCLVVRSSRHKRHEGTFFQLRYLHQLFASHVNEGKLTIVIRHQRQLCSVFIETVNDVNELRIMAATLQDRRSWSMIERNVACKQSKNGSYAMNSTSNTNRNNNSSSGNNTYASGRLRDPMLAPLQNEDYDSNDDNDESESDIESRKQENDNIVNNNTIIAPLETVIDNNTFDNTNSDQNSLSENYLSQQESSEHDPLTLSEDMRKALHYVKNGENVFITIPASCCSNTDNIDKMEMWFVSLSTLLERKMHKHVLFTSPMASATHKCNRLNIYSLLCIRPHKTQFKLDRVLHKIKKDVDKWQLWQHCEVCIVEEVHLLPANVFTLLCQVVSAFRKNTNKERHEAIQWIVLGDFLQLPPYSFGVNTRNEREQENATDSYAFLSEEWQKCKFMHIHLDCDNSSSSNKNTLTQCAEDVRKGKWSNAVEQTWRTVCNSSENEKEFEANTVLATSSALSSETVNSSITNNIITEIAAESKSEKLEIEPVEMFVSREEANRHNLHRLGTISEINNNNNNNNNNLTRLYHYESDDYASIPGTNIDENVVLLPHLSLKVGAQVIILSNDLFAIAPPCVDNNTENMTKATTYCKVERGEVGLIVDFTCITNNKFIAPHIGNSYNNINSNNIDEKEEEEVLPIVYFPRKKVSVVVHRILIEVRCDTSGDTVGNDNDTIAWTNKHLFMSRKQLPLSLCWAISLYDTLNMTLPQIHVSLSLVNCTNSTNKEILCVRKEQVICGFLYVILTRVLRASDICITFTDNVGVDKNSNNVIDVLRNYITHKSASHVVLKYYATHFPHRYECVLPIEQINSTEGNTTKNDERRREKRGRSVTCDNSNNSNSNEDIDDINSNNYNNAEDEEYALHDIAVNMPISHTIPSFTQDSQLYELNNTQSTLIKGLLLDDE